MKGEKKPDAVSAGAGQASTTGETPTSVSTTQMSVPATAGEDESSMPGGMDLFIKRGPGGEILEIVDDPRITGPMLGPMGGPVSAGSEQAGTTSETPTSVLGGGGFVIIRDPKKITITNDYKIIDKKLPPLGGPLAPGQVLSRCAATTSETPTQTSVPVTAGEKPLFSSVFEALGEDEMVMRLAFIWIALSPQIKEKDAPSFYHYTMTDIGNLKVFLENLGDYLHMSGEENKRIPNQYDALRRGYVKNIESYLKAIESMITVDRCRVDKKSAMYEMHPVLGELGFDNKMSLLYDMLKEFQRNVEQEGVDYPEERWGALDESRNPLSLFGKVLEQDRKPAAGSVPHKNRKNKLYMLLFFLAQKIAETPYGITLGALRNPSQTWSSELMGRIKDFINVIEEREQKIIERAFSLCYGVDRTVEEIAIMVKQEYPAAGSRILGGAFIGENKEMNDLLEFLNVMKEDQLLHDAIGKASAEVEKRRSELNAIKQSAEDKEPPAGPALQ